MPPPSHNNAGDDDCPSFVKAAVVAMKEANRRLNEHEPPDDASVADAPASEAELLRRIARLEEEVEQARAAAEAAERARSVFLSNMSHEIRTPLTSIIGFASALVKGSEGKNLEYARRIEDGGYRLMDTLGAMLTLARLEAGEAELQPATLEVVREVREVAQAFHERARRRGLFLRFAVAPEAQPARAVLDEAAFTTVLRHLLQNALRFTEQGGVTIRVTVERRSDAPDVADVPATPPMPRRWVGIHVQDTGIGIDPAFVPRLFDAFQQESTGLSRSHEGAGVGLAIARRLVHLMQGRLVVESEKGRGSTFSVWLPVAEPGTGEAQKEGRTGSRSRTVAGARITSHI